MKRAVGGVIVGYAVWTALWLGGGAGLNLVFPVPMEGEPITSLGFLLGALLLSVFCSFLAGFTNAALAKEKSKGAVLIMAGLLLLTGIGVQAGIWSIMPLWYHLVFLALLVPVSVLGGRAKAGEGGLGA